MIRLENISKYYYSETAVTLALRKINLEFQKGEFVAITGESGSGKSTLLNLISGMDTFDEGELYFRGEPTFQYDEADWEEYRRDKIGFVFQNYSLIGHYTAKDNIISALLIQGISLEEAEQKAREYLEQVGLLKLENQRASELSSGQKQRLSIARALAKNTDILVADEPTGNLDTETGNAIIQILKKVSEDKLVLMVTHNYDQAKAYVTRKVRLHDGELVTDVLVKDGKEFPLSGEELVEEAVPEETRTNSNPVPLKSVQWNHILYFVKRNIMTQKARAALFLVFCMLTASVSFLFLGEMYVNRDDLKTKVYDDDAFMHKSDSRLCVRHPDGSAISEEDLAQIKKLRHVESVDMYDYANDVNYYIREGSDYEYQYADKQEGQAATSQVQLLRDTNFVMSDTVLSKSDLKKGDLPKNRNEVVLFTVNEDLLGEKIDCFFRADNIWSPGTYYQTQVTIVGLLKEKTEQVYFSSGLCSMLTAGLDGAMVSLDYCFDFRYQNYTRNAKLYPVIGENLAQGEVRASENYTNTQGNGQSMQAVNRKEFPGQAHMTATTVRDGSLGKTEADLEVLNSFTKYSGDFLEMNETTFHQLYDTDSNQAAVYISSYAKTDQVIRALNKLGYESVSTYRVSATKYDPALVNKRLVLLSISLLVLLVLVVLQILILRSLMKIRIKDYYILKFMGMRQPQIARITLLEMMTYSLGAVIVTTMLMLLLSVLGVGLLQEMLAYLSWPGILVFALYNLILMLLTVLAFNRLVKKRI